MTREELVHKWNSYKGIIIYPTDNVKELINATIEELEQESVLDKIRAEIFHLHDWAFDRDEVLKIIDKYRQEVEE